MLTTVLRKSGGSVTMTIPRSVLAMLELSAGDVLVVEIAGTTLILRRPQVVRKPRGTGPRPAEVGGR